MAAALETLQALFATLAEIQELPLNRESRKYLAPLPPPFLYSVISDLRR